MNSHFRIITLLLSAGACFMTVSCERAKQQDQSILTIKTGDFQKKFQKNIAVTSSSVATSSLADLALNEICYAADIRGSGIENKEPLKDCSGSLGIHSEFVQPGEEIKLSVPRGANREVRVFLYKRVLNSPCPSAKFVFSAAEELQKSYLIAERKNIQIEKSSETVELSLNLPDSHNTLLASAPPTCTSSEAPVPQFSFNAFRFVIGFGSTETSQLKLEMRVLAQGVLR